MNRIVYYLLAMLAVSCVEIDPSLVRASDENATQASSDATKRNQRKRAAGKIQWDNPGREKVPHAIYKTFDSKHAASPVSYMLYLPPSYEVEQNRRFPVVYWLHGSRGSVTTGGHFIQCLHRAIEASRAPEMIVILVNGLPKGGYVDWADGSRPVQSVIIKDLIPHIDETYRTLAVREGRAIEGFSMGGGGAFRLGFKYPELFCAISSIASGAANVDEAELAENEMFQLIFGGNKALFDNESVRLLARKNKASIHERTSMRMMVGQADPHFQDVQALHENLTQAGLDISYESFPEIEHDYKKIYDVMDLRAFDFYKRVFPQ